MTAKIDPVVAPPAFAGAAVGLVEIALLLSAPADASRVPVLFPLVGWIWIAAGVAVAARRPGNRMAVLLAAGGLAPIAAGFAHTSIEALAAAGTIAYALPVAVAVHALLAFPSGRAGTVIVPSAYVVCLLLQAPQYLFADGPTTVLRVADRPELANAGAWAQSAAGACVLAAAAVILARRRRSASQPQRTVRTALSVAVLAAVLFVAASAEVATGGAIGGDPGLLAVQLTALAAIPLAIAAALLRGGFARAGELAELAPWLRAEDDRRSGLAEALADWLGDASLQLLFWVPELEAYVDAAGREVGPPQDRAAVEVSLGDRRVGAIVYDTELIAEPGLMRAAGRVVALALDNERLTSELLASHERLRQSRARIVEAADGERRRIARDLHDGLQARLVLLAIQADRVRAETIAAGGESNHAVELHRGLQTAITELRELVHDVIPAALTEGGLYAAVEDLADHVPVVVDLELEGAGRRLPAPVESTAYFVISEAVTNAVKHSRANALTVRLANTEGRLQIEVADDGVGGARLGPGGGMRGIADRVEALGGEVAVESPPGGGTRIAADIPI